MLLGPAGGQHRQGHQRGDDRHRHLEPEDRPPRHEIGEHAADEWAHPERGGVDHTPGPEATAGSTGTGVDRHHLDGGGHDERRAQPLHRPADDHHGRAGCRRGQQRPGREHQHPGHERPCPAHDVTQPTADQGEGGRGQQVGPDHPREVGQRERQLVDHAPAGDPDRGGVQPHHGHGQRHRHDGRGGDPRPSAAARGCWRDGGHPTTVGDDAGANRAGPAGPPAAAGPAAGRHRVPPAGADYGRW